MEQFHNLEGWWSGWCLSDGLFRMNHAICFLGISDPFEKSNMGQQHVNSYKIMSKLYKKKIIWNNKWIILDLRVDPRWAQPSTADLLVIESRSRHDIGRLRFAWQIQVSRCMTPTHSLIKCCKKMVLWCFMMFYVCFMYGSCNVYIFMLYWAYTCFTCFSLCSMY